MNGVIIGIVPFMYYLNQIEKKINVNRLFLMSLILLLINFFNTNKNLFILDQNKLFEPISSHFIFIDGKKLDPIIKDHYVSIETFTNFLNKKCKIENAVNLSNDGFVSSIFDKKLNLIQKHPLLRNHQREISLEKYVNKDILISLKNNITAENIIIYSELEKIEDNLIFNDLNIKFLKFDKYKISNKKFIFFPRKCNLS
tara:strand:- start:565 stop:1161 length:597 start_codon:yes stop_codon:yes gene_type:complete